jgi:RNA polymerase sigma-70 factor (ECF subfamily)
VLSFRDELLRITPQLRAFAISLSGNLDLADDLVQETILRALANSHRFEPGTSLQAWAFTILRNFFLTDVRSRRKLVEDPDGMLAASLSVIPNQSGRLEFQELLGALAKLPHEQRETLLLVGAQGFSYEETADITGVQIGTVKSRVSRARARLAELLNFEQADNFGTDRMVKAVLRPNSSP